MIRQIDLLKKLKQYWHYDKFRYCQEEIITEVLKKNDVLTLLPTGAGKSICFQLPAIIKPGICIVISPLLALIKDQIEKLINQGIKAVYVSSSMSIKEIDIILDNCIYGNMKLLYISPERINSQLFIERFKKMNVNLLAVDEAHCISEWGYDFRPSYLQIFKLRELKPGTNIIALTASATKEVRKDIIQKLELNNVKEFKISFKRDNITYLIRKVENKNAELALLLKKVNEPTIVYTYTRKNTKETASFLKYHGIKAIFYHAGLSHKEREEIQKKWTEEKVKIIIATKAFGMGIDKSNVRLVIHISPPLTLEDYYQESGRAGRDNKQSHAILLFNEADIFIIKEKLEKKYPKIDFIKSTYLKIANYLNMAIGSGKMVTYNFDLDEFVDIYKLNIIETYNTIKILERHDILKFNSKDIDTEDKLFIKCSPEEIYKYRIQNEYHNKVIEIILRLYGGELFSEFCKISKINIARKSNIDILDIIRILNQLHKKDIIEYKPKSESETITFLEARVRNINSLPLNINEIKKRKKIDIKKAESIINYLKNKYRCKSQILLEYFDEVSYEKCGKCDNCKKESINDNQKIETMIIKCIKTKIDTFNKIVETIDPYEKDMIISILRKMMKDEIIEFKDRRFTMK